ncbi:hypothetical protein GJ496_008737 [Pomphorhynchus laevis]|nr:hypothetical protein GJ496_008737 [Pomphorhynchus laevis]
MVNSASSEQSLLHAETAPVNNPEISKYDVLKQRLLLFLKDNEKLRDEIFDLNLNYNKEKTKRQDAELLIVNLYKQIQKLESEVSDYQDNIKELKRKYEEISHAASISERERKSLEQRTYQDEDRILNLEKELHETNIIATSSSKRIEDLTDCYDQAKSKFEFYEKKCFTLDDRLKVVEAELIDSNKTTMIISLKFNKAENEIDRLNVELDKSKKLQNIFESRAEQCQNDHDKLLQQINTLESKLEEEEELRRRLQIEMETYERDVNSL